MTPNEMALRAAIALQGRTQMSLVVPRPWRNRPSKFPRGELLCQQADSDIRSFDPLRVLAWLAAQGLVKVVPVTPRLVTR